jgi:outer membrane protein TolC
MTTIAMILGMMPSAFGNGDGSEFRAPISIATIGGLLTSTLLTLVVVPVSYLLLERGLARVRAFREAPLPAWAKAAARVTGILLVLALIGAFLSVARAFAGPPSASAPHAQTPAPASATQARTLTIDRAVQLAVDRNESLKVNQERLRESQAHVSEAKAAFLPSLNLNFLYTPTQASPLLKIPAGVFGPNEQTFRANLTRENVMRFDISQPLYTGGRLSNAYAAQAAGEEASRLDVERSRQGLILEVYESFYAALMNEQGVRVNEEGVTIAQKHLELAKARFDAGSAARLDVLRAEVELANAKAKLIRARSETDVAYQRLRTVLSLPQGEPLQLAGTLDEIPNVPSAGVIETALGSRADIRSLGQQREAAQRLVSLANAEMKPIVAFSGNYQYQEDGLSSLLQGSNRSYQFGLNFTVPLFNAPTVAAKRGAAAAQVRQAEHAMNAALDNARLDVASASRELDAAREIVTTEEKAVDMAREGLTIAEVSYENGVITATELNDARLSLLETEWQLMQAKYGQIVAAARTRFAAGV